MRRVKSKDEKICEAIAAALGAGPRTPKPPQEWWDEHVKRIREQHPEYNNDRVNATVGAIWYKKYSKDKQELAVLAEALRHS